MRLRSFSLLSIGPVDPSPLTRAESDALRIQVEAKQRVAIGLKQYGIECFSHAEEARRYPGDARDRRAEELDSEGIECFEEADKLFEEARELQRRAAR